MTGTIVLRKASPVAFTSVDDAYEQIFENNLDFEAAQDITDRETAKHVLDAISRRREELDGANQDALGTIYAHASLHEMFSTVSKAWDI